MQTVDVPEDESDDEYQVIAKKSKTTVDAVQPVDTAAATETLVDHDIAETAKDQSAEDMHGVETAAADAGPVSDADWLRSRTNRVLDFVEDDEVPAAPAPAPVRQTQPKPVQQSSPEVAPQQEEAKQAEPRPEDVPPSAEVDRIRETGRLYVRNLHFEVTEEELRDQFAKYGSLQEVCSITISLLTLAK